MRASRRRNAPSPVAPADPTRRLGQLISDLGNIQDAGLALETAMRAGMELFRARGAAALLFDERNRVRQSHTSGLARPVGPAAVEGLARVLIRSGPAYEARRMDLTDDPERESSRGLTRGGLRVVLTLPLVHRGGLQGGLGFFDPQPPEAPDDPIAWSSLLAGAVSLCLENIRLSEGALEQSTELGAFYEAAASLGDEDELPLLLSAVLNRACSLLGCQGGLAYLARSKGGDFALVASLGLDPAHEPETMERTSLAGRVAESSQPMRLEFTESADRSAEPYRSHNWIRHTLAAPLIWRHEVIGVIELLADAPRRPFLDADLRLATLIAQQAASATGIARLIEAERRHRNMAEALQSASLVLGRELEFDRVLDRILDEVMRAIPCDAANFQDLQGDRSRVIRSRGYHRFGLDPQQLLSMELPVAESRSLQRMIAGETVVIADITKDPDWVARPGLEWLRSRVGVPIRLGEAVLGFIHLDSATPGAFDADTARLLGAFAAPAASAMHNARLYRQRLEENVRLETVHEIGRQLASSLDPSEILHRLLENACRAVSAPFGVALRAARRAGGRPEQRAWWPPDRPMPVLAAHPAMSELASEALRTGRLQLLQGEARAPLFRAWAVPLSAGAQVWGVALLWTSAGGAGPAPGAEEILAPIGHLAGLALANAERHAHVERRLAELTLLQKVVSSIARQLEAEAVLGEVVEQLHQNLGYPAVMVYRRAGNELSLDKHAGPAPVVENLSLQRGIIGRVARTGHPAFVRDVRKDPDYVAGLIGTVAQIAVPIRQGREVFAVLKVETSDPYQFDAGSLELLELLADQVSVSLQNASLYEAVQRNVETLGDRVHERTAMLERVLEQARAAERVKSQFVADVSHELRTPLTNIGLYLDLLEIGAKDRRADYMETLRREVDRLGTLIEQLLAISHLDREQVELRHQPTDLNHLVEMLVQGRSRQAELKGLTLQAEPASELPPVDIDPMHILQAMTNLVTNAILYTPSGGAVTLRTARQAWKSRPGVAFSVADTGPGIPEGDKDRIFDRFYRGLVGRTSGAAGTGLGLAISKEIVDLHDGRISLSSQAGKGATFTIWLPEATRPG